jgi:peroxiredoxin
LTSASRPATAAVGTAFKLKTIDGEPRTLADVRGSKATLVVFFYPKCPYCNAEAPSIQKIADTYRAQGLSVVYINILPEQDNLVRDWQNDHHYTFPVLVGASTQSVGKDYSVSATPTHYLLGPNGRVLATRSGFQPGDEKTLEEEVTAALGMVR